jgi:hypothetical protein
MKDARSPKGVGTETEIVFRNVGVRAYYSRELTKLSVT